jgi:tryptophan halogenase
MNLVIVGGGTAGWITALYANKLYPDYKITLIESEEIGILGAGEGATPVLNSFLTYLDIDIVDLIKETNSVIKNGIKFTNWSDSGDSYYHPFVSEIDASNDANFTHHNYEEQSINYSHIYAALNNHSWKDYSLISKLSESQKSPFIFLDDGFMSISNWSYHFNARMLAEFLRKVGEERGIARVEGIVKSFTQDLEGNINSLYVDNKTIKCDFVFDCTGFSRFFIGKHFKSEWISHSEYLPAKKAIPFFIPKDSNLPPYTESTAMSSGWIWKIPTQDRYGCGYVFDSDYISDEDAIKEIENYLGFVPEYPRGKAGAFNFSAGCYKEIWIKNCLAVGLSAGFIEPLEATSIMQFIMTLIDFFSNPSYLKTNNSAIKNKFNNQYIKDTNEVVDFIYLHYLTNKKGKFWEEFKSKNKTPEFIEFILEVIKERPINSIDFNGRRMFVSYSYDYVLIGNEILSQEMLLNHHKDIKYDKSKTYGDIVSKQSIILDRCSDHKETINTLKNQYDYQY